MSRVLFPLLIVSFYLVCSVGLAASALQSGSPTFYFSDFEVKFYCIPITSAVLETLSVPSLISLYSAL